MARIVLKSILVLWMRQSSVDTAETTTVNAVNQKNGGLNEEDCSDGSLGGDRWA